MHNKNNPPLSLLLLFLCLSISSTSAWAKGLSANTSVTSTTTEPLPPVLAQTHFADNLAGTTTPETLPDSILLLLKKYKIPTENLSVYVRDLNAKQPLLAHNIDVIRSPASTMKLLTTYAALKILSPNYSWRTEAWVRGEIVDGTLAGDLIIKGYGDPFLSYENYSQFVRGLREKGLKHIQGDVIIDNSYFDIGDFNPAAFDNKPFRTYNAAPSALMFNFQSTRFLFTPDEENKKIVVTPYPAIPSFKFTNEINYTDKRCRRSHYRPKFSVDKEQNLTIKGWYSKKCGQKFILRALSTPEEHAFNGFRDFWMEQGGTLNGTLRIAQKQSGDTRFHLSSSATLGEQIRLINKWSNNVMTRQVLLTLGAKRYGVPATLQKGRDAVIETLQESHIQTNGIVIDNGSGLSRTARITARQMAQLLETAYREPYMPEFMASLALSGLDGTMVRRFRKGDLRGRSHMKTGTLNNVTAIAGYMLNRQGKRLVIVIQHNGKKTNRGRGKKIQNALLRWSFEQ
ncbi:MAG TPA: D-alanyl-D-alanine carboxypeptidase/D-alanyl-D-alanine-endopeptidase [Leucothrix mucor]|uniref:D-alanyl-D-alanine carboxypeptidase/D-alanyl-D-alanine-endopeptidase n=1 Tax=Leucothrix mucor TaxID=45248 RepID=A0A7V2SYP8_LEUMU|nr:D-alanyl-D-alanine carboxypeptidase/D-alanyl-D-alanine-endopeptidase [Leucothrix mucor]